MQRVLQAADVASDETSCASLPRTLTRAAPALLVLALLVEGYRRFVRQRVLNWGATPEEVAAPMAGDELLADADVTATRAVTIDAPPAAVWPWLVQMGVGRGGAYTYDWIERLFGLDIHNVDRIVPELQHLRVGDVLPMRPNEPGMRVEVLDAERAMSARSEDESWVWSFALVPGNGSTRLISRNRIRVHGRGERAVMPAMEAGSLVMEHKMLHTIKELAETRVAESAG
jgi:hypothetical protein